MVGMRVSRLRDRLGDFLEAVAERVKQLVGGAIFHQRGVEGVTKSLSLRVRNSPRYVLTSCACAASAISSASRFSSS